MINIDLVDKHNLCISDIQERTEAFNMLCHQLYDPFCDGDIGLYMIRLNTMDKMDWFEIRLMLQKILEIPFCDKSMSERQKNVCQKIGFAITQILPYSALIENADKKMKIIENLN